MTRSRISGSSAGYAIERDDASVALGISWINDIAEAGTFKDAFDEAGDEAERGASTVGGTAASLVASFGGLQVITEYVAAMSKFNAGELAFRGAGAEPTAWMAEASYSFEFGGRGATVAFGVQSSEQAVGLGLPETRFLFGISTELAEALSLSFEWAREEDYSQGDGGTGNTANRATVVLAAEF